MSQLEMFSAAPAPLRSTVPTAESVRPRLEAVLDQLRAGRVADWSEAEYRRWCVVFPQMCAWLPEDEAQAKRAAFRELIAAH